MKSANKLAALCLLCNLSSCGDPLKEGQRVEELRVLGAQLRVDDDPARATPMPGEAARVEWLLVDPSGVPPMAVWSMRVCVAEETSYGVPLCRSAPLAAAKSSELTNATPTLNFTLPDNETLGAASRLAVLAVFCDGGEPELSDDFEHSTCPGATTVQRASFDIFVGSPTYQNHNPDLETAELTLAGQVWQEPAQTPDCANSELPMIAAGDGKQVIELTLPQAAREAEDRELDAIDLESLQVSHVATLGLLDRRFSSIAPEDTNFTLRLPWETPKSVTTAVLASFYFVIRDDRGGAAWLTRSACVSP